MTKNTPELMSNKKQRKKEMDEFRNPHILTLDQALELSDTDASKDAAAHSNSARKAVSAIRNRIGCRCIGPSNFDQLTYGERLVLDLTSMDGEVLNGSFEQYLTNSTGESGEDVKVYLASVGAAQTLELFRLLSEIFPGGTIPRDREQRCAAIEKWYDMEASIDIFDELSNRYYRQSESLDVLIVEYVRKHRADFVEPSDIVVMNLKRHDRITEYYCGTSVTEWVEGAGEALETLTALAEELLTTQAIEQENELKLMISAGKRTVAIRKYRKLFGCSLAEAKAAVDRLAKS